MESEEYEVVIASGKSIMADNNIVNNQNDDIKQLLKSMFNARTCLMKCQNKGYKRIIIEKDLLNIQTENGDILNVYNAADDKDDKDDDNNDNNYNKDDDNNDESDNDNNEDDDNNDEDNDNNDDDNDEDNDNNDDDNDEDNDNNDDDNDEDDKLLSKKRQRQQRNKLSSPSDKLLPIKRRRQQHNKLSLPSIEMGKDLHNVLKNIHKLPSPPPTHNPKAISSAKYRKILTNHLIEISNVNEFILSNSKYCLSNNDTIISKSQQHTLNYILNEEDDKGDEGDVGDNYDNAILEKYSKDLSNIVDTIPDLLQKPSKEFEEKKNAACTYLAKIIIDIYNISSNDYVAADNLRRRQFQYYLTILVYYRKLEMFCNLSQKREKGKTIKSQAVKTIVRTSKPQQDSLPKIKANDITLLLRRAIRIERLLKLSNDNFDIFNAIPDLHATFFTKTDMNVINYEIWLKLVETNTIISVAEGKKLYENYKVECKKERAKNMKVNSDFDDETMEDVYYDEIMTEEEEEEEEYYY